MIIDESNAHEYVETNVMIVSHPHITELRYVPPNVEVLYCWNNLFDVEYLEYLRLKYPNLIEW